MRQIAARQRGRVTRKQLVGLGMTSDAIKHRVAKGRLEPDGPGVYLYGAADDSAEGRWTSCVLRCGEEAALSHSHAALHRDLEDARYPMPLAELPEVSLPARFTRSPGGVIVFRRRAVLTGNVERFDGIPTTSAPLTIIDNAYRWGNKRTEAAINAADASGQATPKEVHDLARQHPHVPGSKPVCELLDRRTFRLTRSELERHFKRIVAPTWLPVLLTREWVNGFEVDFWIPDLDLIVETHGGAYHRTPGQQTADARRVQAHLVAGTTPLVFTHEQVYYEPDHVRRTLLEVAERLAGARRAA